MAAVRERKAAGEAVGRCDDTDGWRARLQDFRRANARIRDAQEDVDAGVPARVCFMQAVREVEDKLCGAWSVDVTAGAPGSRTFDERTLAFETRRRMSTQAFMPMCASCKPSEKWKTSFAARRSRGARPTRASGRTRSRRRRSAVQHGRCRPCEPSSPRPIARASARIFSCRCSPLYCSDLEAHRETRPRGAGVDPSAIRTTAAAPS